MRRREESLFSGNCARSFNHYYATNLHDDEWLRPAKIVEALKRESDVAA